MNKKKVWRVKETGNVLQRILAKELQVSSIIARLLINRGIYTVDAALDFLYGKLEHTGDPELMTGMEEAVCRISRALKDKEKILVYGDYDADGITATALLVSFLRRLGGNVNYYIPHRLEEGYGMSSAALERAQETGHTLIITVDCGISNKDIVDENNSNGGPDIIITDHHEPPPEIPGAAAVINPKRVDCRYPFKELAGVGVAFKLCQALQKKIDDKDALKQELYSLLDLVCTGTIADIVPLHGENRIIVKYGLYCLSGTCNPGLRALMDVSSIDQENIDTGKIGFGIAPRLNAAGRLGDASIAVDLLLAEDYERAREIAAELEQENRQRQKMEAQVLAEAEDMLESSPDMAEKTVLVLASPNWHPGIIGIVASRLLDKYYRPVLLIALDGDTGKGSARSIPGLNMYRALEYCSGLLISYGGHSLAAGFSLAAEDLENFREEINAYADSVLTPELMIPGIDLDAEVCLDEINEKLVGELDKLSPYGYGNPQPLFACRDVFLANYKGVGRGRSHLKMMVRDNKTYMDGIGFNLGAYEEILATREVDLAFVPSVNLWNGKREIQLEVKDLKPAVTGNCSGKTGGREICGVLRDAGEYLAGDNPGEFFKPVFVRRELALCGIKEVPGKNLDIKGPDSIDFSGEIIDRRNCTGRDSILRDICSSEEKIIITVNAPSQTVEILYFLTCGCRFPREVIAVHSWYHKDYGHPAQALDSENVKILIVTPEFFGPGETSAAASLVFYDIPYCPAEYFNLLNICTVFRAYLLFNEYDALKACGYLESLAPGRSFMAGFYNFLRALADKSCFHFSVEKAAELMRKNNFTVKHNFSIEIALKVLKELYLIDYIKNRDYEFKLHSTPGSKMSLDNSLTYNYLQRKKKSNLDWQKEIISIKDVRELTEVEHNIL